MTSPERGLLDTVAGIEVLPVDAAAARHWGRLRARLAETGRRLNVNDLWTAAIAAANDLPVVTQDVDFDALEELGGPRVIRI